MAKSDDDLILTALGIGIGWSVAERSGVEKLLKRNSITAKELQFAIENYHKRKNFKNLIGNGLNADMLGAYLSVPIHRRYFRTRVLFVNGFFEESIVSGCILLEMIFRDKLSGRDGFKPRMGGKMLLDLAFKSEVIDQKEQHFISGFIITRNETVHKGDAQDQADAVHFVKIIERLINKLYF